MTNKCARVATRDLVGAVIASLEAPRVKIQPLGTLALAAHQRNHDKT